MKTTSLLTTLLLSVTCFQLGAQYCTLSGQTPYSSLQPGITNFQLNSINRTSGNSESSSAVVVFTGLSTTLTAGQTYTVSITHSEDYQYFPGARNNIRVWIDYNNNFSWLDAGETVVSKDFEAPATTYTTSITIPSTLTAGTYALRATAKMSSDAGHTLPTPCNSPSDPLGYHGEMEDYSIVVQGGTQGQTPLSAFALNTNTVCVNTAATTSNTSAGTPAPTFSWSASPSAGVTFSPSATASNPTIKFTNGGTYSIACLATNSVGTNSSSKTMTVSACNSVGLSHFERVPARFYPKPANDQLIIENAGCSVCEVHIVDCVGKTAIQKNVETEGNKLQLNISCLPEGLYYLKLNSEMVSPIMVSH